LNNELSNAYVRSPGRRIRSQIETYQYLYSQLKPVTTSLPEEKDSLVTPNML
jgi:hypothetical protein